MKNAKLSRLGFTLIELLVVVLIIGILAAIAVPQYQKAVEKSRAVEGIAIMKNLIQAIDAYHMEYGEYPQSLESFDLPDSFSGRVTPYHNLVDWRSNANWSIGLFNMAKYYGVGIHITNINGKYEGTGFAYDFYRKNSNEKINENKFFCREYAMNLGDVSKFAGNPGDYCEKILKAVYYPSYSTEFRYYLMP